MKKTLKVLQVFIFPVFMVLVLFTNKIQGIDVKKVISELLPNNDYKLKFVDSTEIELGLSGVYKIILPVEILSMEEKDGLINVKTYENAVIVSPLKLKVVKVNRCENSIELNYSKITICIQNILTGLQEGACVECGEVIGSVIGDTVNIKVLWGTRVLSLEEIRNML